jgi:hypothetical protein
VVPARFLISLSCQCVRVSGRVRPRHTSETPTEGHQKKPGPCLAFWTTQSDFCLHRRTVVLRVLVEPPLQALKIKAALDVVSISDHRNGTNQNLFLTHRKPPVQLVVVVISPPQLLKKTPRLRLFLEDSGPGRDQAQSDFYLQRTPPVLVCR